MPVRLTKTISVVTLRLKGLTVLQQEAYCSENKRNLKHTHIYIFLYIYTHIGDSVLCITGYKTSKETRKKWRVVVLDNLGQGKWLKAVDSSNIFLPMPLNVDD